MPSDLDLTDSQFDPECCPIAIGFQSAEGETADGGPDLGGPDLNQADSVDIGSSTADDSLGSPEAMAGYELVTDMMRRQDEVLEQLDALNDRIELAIKQISDARKNEIEALEAQGQLLDDDDQAMDRQKAA